MTHVIRENSCLKAWQNASGYLLAHKKSQFNMVISIDDPTTYTQTWLTQYNPRRIILSGGNRGDNLADVVNTIFPVKLAARATTKEDLYADYIKRHIRRSRLGERKSNRWGTYFQRLIFFETDKTLRSTFEENDTVEQIKKKLSQHQKINQLDNIITALSSWKSNTKAALYCHLSSMALDTLRPLGAPCLQFIEFMEEQPDKIDLLAVYRNHDYFNKALGNFIGLGQLLKYVCAASGKTPGKLVCHSARGYIDVPTQKFRQLI